MLQEHAEPVDGPGPTTTITGDLTDEYERVAHIADVHQAAETVFNCLERSGRLRLLLTPLTQGLANHRRNHVRDLEHAVVAEAEAVAEAVATRTRKPARPRQAIPTLRSLLAESFFTGERWVRYDEAVAVDYRASVAFLRAKVDGLTRTIAFRSMCAEVIDAHPGAETLADVPDEVLADVLAHRA